MSARRTSGRAVTIDEPQPIALAEIWTYVGAGIGEKRNALWGWMAVNPLALVFCDKLKLNATQH